MRDERSAIKTAPELFSAAMTIHLIERSFKNQSGG
jgi:hypothetical protein